MLKQGYSVTTPCGAGTSSAASMPAGGAIMSGPARGCSARVPNITSIGPFRMSSVSASACRPPAALL